MGCTSAKTSEPELMVEYRTKNIRFTETFGPGGEGKIIVTQFPDRKFFEDGLTNRGELRQRMMSLNLNRIKFHPEGEANGNIANLSY
jgi:hypothetical protein